MNWYLARFVFQIVGDDGSLTPQFDEQLRLIKADEIKWATEKATILGHLQPEFFTAKRNANVNWKFVNVADVQQISSMEDGEQIYSITSRPSNVQDYLATINANSARLLAPL